MNNSRILTDKLASIEIKITPYWFLGFAEGESTFRVEKSSFQQTFAIALASVDKPVILAISQFLLGLIPNELNHLREKGDLVRIYEGIQSLSSSSDEDSGKVFRIVKLYFSKFDFISKVFSPFLENLTFLSKKELDYKDWLIVTQLKLKGLHKTDEGKEAIKFICGRMNSYRLSTNLNSNNTLTIQKQEEMNQKIKTLLE